MNAEQETQHDRNDLLNRIDMMETLVQEGRRSTEHWGWCFLLWGAAYLIAMVWSYGSQRPDVAWPVTMIVAAGIFIVIGSRRKTNPRTKNSRAIGGTWTAVGCALFIYGFSASVSGHAEIHSFFAAIEALLGVANFSSAAILRWRTQFAVAIAWWAAAIASCFVNATMVLPVFVAATLVGMIGFGLYLMYREHHPHSTAVQHG
jgi:hypothetical protein